MYVRLRVKLQLAGALMHIEASSLHILNTHIYRYDYVSTFETGYNTQVLRCTYTCMTMSVHLRPATTRRYYAVHIHVWLCTCIRDRLQLAGDLDVHRRQLGKQITKHERYRNAHNLCVCMYVCMYVYVYVCNNKI